MITAPFFGGRNASARPASVWGWPWRMALVAFALLIGTSPAFAQGSLATLGTAYTQNFDTLGTSGSGNAWADNTTLTGWYLQGGADTSYLGDTGSRATNGLFYSYGPLNNSDRALGTYTALSPLYIGVRLKNDTGSTITAITVTYNGEQWRDDSDDDETVAFSYLTGTPVSTDLSASGTAVPALDFTSPKSNGGATAVALSGNSTSTGPTGFGGRVAITATITGLSLAAGDEIMLRWRDDFATDHGMAIDDLSVTPFADATVASPTSASITSTAATLGGDITSDGGSAITERGVVYAPTATNNNPEIGGTGVVQVVEGGTATGAFTKAVTGLAGATAYSFKAYATNASGTSYTPVATFWTLGPAVLTAMGTAYTQDFNTLASTGTGDYTSVPGWYSVTGTPASASTQYTADDGTATVARFLSLGTASDPDRALGSFTGSADRHTAVHLINSTGATVAALRVQYTGEQWRRGATGETLQFHYTTTVDSSSSAALAASVANAADAVTGLDFVTPSTGTAGAIPGGVRTTNTATITGLNLAPGAEIILRWKDSPTVDLSIGIDDVSVTPFGAAEVTTPTSASITTTSATLGGNITSDGGSTITARGVVYSMTATNADPVRFGTGVSSAAAAGTGTGVFTTNGAVLSVGTQYSFKAYVTTAAGTFYSSVATFTTLSSTPTVTTPTAARIGSLGATLGGNVTSDRGSAITERGVVYALTTANSDPLIDDPSVIKVTTTGTTGVFTIDIAGLTAATGYSYKAYATNANGTTYTSVATFTTLGAPVLLTALGASYTQNFDTLGSTGAPAWVDNNTLTGWYLQKVPGPTPNIYFTDRGDLDIEAFASWGALANAERALGSRTEPSTLHLGLRLRNDTGSAITALTVAYTGEQWSKDGSTNPETLAFSYLTPGDADLSVSGTPVTELDFVSPVNTASVSRLDGNLAANRVAISHTITGLSLAPGQEIMLRWTDLPTTDHGMGIDDLSITPYGTATVTAITPDNGNTGGGTGVTITGTNFHGATGATIGGSALSSFSLVNSTTITGSSPAHAAGTVDVVVAAPAGNATGVGLFTYAAVSAPTVTSISPSSGTTAGGTSVTITGTGFTAGSTVTFGFVAATGVSVVNATTITATTQAGFAGTVSVVVTAAGGSNSPNSLYAYVAPTSTTLTTSGSPSVYGGAVSFTATVTDLSIPFPVNAALVRFYNGGASCASPGTQIGSDQVTNSLGKASVIVPRLSVAGSPHTIRACFLGSVFRAASEGSVSQTVNAKAITITPNSGQSKVFGAADPTLTYAASPALVSGDTFTGSVNRASGEGAGTYAITLGTLSAGGNYDVSLAASPVTFEITKKLIVVTPDSGQSKTYGQADPVFTYTFSPALEGLDTITGSLSRVSGESVNAYAFTLGTLSAGGNYDLSLVAPPVTFEITKKAIVVTPNSGQSKIYGASDPTLSYTPSPALESGDTFSGALSRVSGEDVGTYDIAIGSLAAGGNYDVTLSPTVVTFEITKKILTVTGAVANDRDYDGGTAATVDFTGASLVTPIGGDDVTLDTTGYSASFTTKAAAAGKAVTVTGVTLGGADAGNYTVSQPTGLVADVNPKHLTGSFTAANKAYDGTTAATVTSRSAGAGVSGDDVTLEGGTATFNTAAIGAGKTVTLTGATLGGIDKDNYTLDGVDTTTADITTPTAGDVDTLNALVDGSTVNAIAVQPDGKFVIAGSFTSVLGQPRARIARLTEAGALDTSFAPEVDGFIYALAVQADGKVVIGGQFTTVNSETRSNIARIDATGALDATFVASADAPVLSLAIEPDGQILMAGQFNQVAGTGDGSPTPIAYLARLNGDGTLDSLFNPAPANFVTGVAVQPDGHIVFSGGFTGVGGASPVTRFFVARVDANGTVDAFNPNADGTVYGMALQTDGSVLLGGAFTAVGGEGRLGLARVDSTGAVDLTFNPNVLGGAVASIAVQTDGRILIGGSFIQIGATPRNYVARLEANGAVDASFDPNPNNEVSALALQADGKVLMGGPFSTLQPNGAAAPVSRNLFARLVNDEATESLTVPSDSRVEWLRGGSSPETQHVTFEVSTDSGASYAPLGSGARIIGGWELTGLTLPTEGQVRARARTTGGLYSGSGGLVEAITAFAFAADCAPGTFSPNGQDAPDACTEASVGHYVPVGGATEELACAAGQYQDVTGQTSCKDADAGHFVLGGGAATQTACSAGSFQPLPGQTSCSLATAGHFVASPGATSQGTCAPGTFQALAGQTSCSAATAGHYVAGSGAASEAACAAGSYQPATGQTSCTLASVGFYVPSSGATSQLACAPGTTSTAGATSCAPISGASLSIGSVSLAEGNSGTKLMKFTVTRTGASTTSTTVNWATASPSPGPGVVPATAGVDYRVASGVATIPAGASGTSVTMNVVILADLLDEPDETFSVQLSNPSAGSLGTATGIGTIVDDDAAPTVAITGVTVMEGSLAPGTTAANLKVTLSAATSRTVTVHWATSAGTATAGVDYQSASGDLTFLPGGALTQNVTVLVNQDILSEYTETFLVTLSAPTNATLGTSVGTGQISNDDTNATLRIAGGVSGDASTITVAEGSSTAAFVYLTKVNAADVSVTWTIGPNGLPSVAASCADFAGGVCATGTVTIPAGSLQVALPPVQVITDGLTEGDQLFRIILTAATPASGPYAAPLERAILTGKILANNN